MADVKQGKVKWFDNTKGYGFIAQAEGGKDLFVHQSNIAMDGYKTLAENQEVKFEVGDSTTVRVKRHEEILNISIIFQ